MKIQIELDDDIALQAAAMLLGFRQEIETHDEPPELNDMNIEAQALLQTLEDAIIKAMMNQVPADRVSYLTKNLG